VEPFSAKDEPGFGYPGTLALGCAGLVGSGALACWNLQLHPGAMWLSVGSWLICLRGFCLWPEMPRWFYCASLGIVVGHWIVLGLCWGAVVRDARALNALWWVICIAAILWLLLTASVIVASVRGRAGALWAGAGGAAFLGAVSIGWLWR
jgi:hypothetical protein